MANDDWFRNTEWNAAIEETFFAKLKRARDKSQYLRIQACYLAERQPQIALQLLVRYFNLGEHFDHAQAHVDRAAAYLTLGDVGEAIKSYEAALVAEEKPSSVKTQAYLKLPFVVATQGITTHYEQALKILSQNRARLMFPVDYFLCYAAQSLIFSEVGRYSEAAESAVYALEAAKKDTSGFRYHPSIGLVGNAHENVRRKLLTPA